MPDPTVVTREEFEVVKEEQRRQAVRLVALEDGLTSLTREVAALREDMDTRFDALEQRLDAHDAHFAALHKLITDGHATITSAIMTLAKK